MGTAEQKQSSPTVRHSIHSVAFWSFLLTQFFGAFNDNYFKQMVLLTCVSFAASPGGSDRKQLAMAAFALPFVLLSGVGGYLSDRLSKQRVITGCKVAEIAITGVGLVILLIPGLEPGSQLLGLISILGLMGAHSAIFGPSKYGILPELFRENQLLPVNGAVQMTTFLAIIFGTVCAGVALDRIQDQLWIGSVIAIGVAATGTMSSLLIPKTPVAVPDLPFRSENLAVPAEIIGLLKQNRGLLMALLVASVFWFLGAVTQSSVNTLGKATFELSATRTSLMVAGIGFGIAAGCVLAGFASRKRGGPFWVRVGSWMLFVSLSLIALLASGKCGQPAFAGQPGGDLLGDLKADAFEWALRLSMVFLGVSAGVFVVPIQVYLQQAPPPEDKGRMIGVQNLMTWIGILVAAPYDWIISGILKATAGATGDVRHQWFMFASLALMMVPICVGYRLPVHQSRN